MSCLFPPGLLKRGVIGNRFIDSLWVSLGKLFNLSGFDFPICKMNMPKI